MPPIFVALPVAIALVIAVTIALPVELLHRCMSNPASLLPPVWSLALSHLHPDHVRRPLYRIQVKHCLGWQLTVQFIITTLVCERKRE